VTNSDTGYSIHEAVFAPVEMTRLSGALDSASLVRTKAGARRVLAVPEVLALASDPRVLDIARHAIGSSAMPYRATLFDKSLSANWLVTWHQDTALPLKARSEHPDWGPWSMKGGVLHAIAPASALERIIALRVHLDDSTTGNGPLRVLPGTHRRGVIDHEAILALANTVREVECVTDAGGVVTLRPLIVHASSKASGNRPRRVLHIEYAPSVRFDHGIELAVG